MKNIALLFAFWSLAVGSLHAQSEVQRFTFDLGGGFTQPVGNTGRHLDEGWNVGGGVGYNFSQCVGAMVDLGYNSFGINSTTLDNLGFPGGGVHIFSATLDPIVHLTPRSHFDLYIIGGGGVYHRNQDFTQPGVATVTGFDPFFGFFPVVSANDGSPVVLFSDETRRRYWSGDCVRNQVAWQVLCRGAL